MRARGLLPRIVGWLLAIPAALSLPALASGLAQGVAAWWASPESATVLLGLPCGVFAGWAISRWANVLRTIEHELTHAVVGLPFGLIPYGIVVTRDRGGLVRQFALPVPVPLILWPLVGMHVSGLAPYSIPLFALTLGFLTPPTWAIAVGIAMGHHLYCKPGEIRSNIGWSAMEMADGEAGHTDIAQSGYIVSAILIPVLALASYGILFHALAYGPAHGARMWLAAITPRFEATLAWAEASIR